MVLAARGESPSAADALRDLCAAYYEPVLAFIRHATGDAAQARDLTHDFFVRLLAKPGLEHLERGRGKFRSYLLGAVKHFLRDAWQRGQSARRGGGFEPLPLEAPGDSQPGLELAAPTENADAMFDREWAVALTGRALTKLEREFEGEKAPLFQTLKPWLTGEAPSPHALAAEQLGLSEGAVKVAVHRLRKRYRELVRAEIAQTVNDPAEAAAELQHLIAALS